MSTATLNPSQELKNSKFGFRDQLGYFFGDFANGLFFTLTTSYLTLFYVDILGLTAASVGVLLLVARIWDAINDPMIGTWIDRQKTGPTGKFRRWILYMAIPVVFFGIASFFSVDAVVNAPLHAKLMYAYVTYIAFGMSYTAINIPYGSLASTMTDNEVERATLSMARSYGGIGASLLLSVLVPMFVFKGGLTPQSSGFIQLSFFLGALAIVSYILCNRLTTERIIVPDTEANAKKDIKVTLRGLAKNRPLIIQMIVGMTAIGMFLMQGSLAPYLFKDYFKNSEMLAANGLLNLVAIFIVSPFIKTLVAKFGKKGIAVFGTFVYAICWTILWIMPSFTLPVYFIFAGLGTVGLTLLTLLTWAFIPDCIDYQEYVTGVREEGTVYAIYSFARKMGQAGAGFLGAYTLIWVGYISTQTVQSPETIQSIKFYVTLIPAVLGFVLALVLHFGYNLDKNRLAEITEELRKNRVA